MRYVVTGVPMLTLQTSVGDTLRGAPFSGNVNASLWTLPVELLCYLVLGDVLAAPFARKRLRLVSALGLLGSLTLATGAATSGAGAQGLFSLATAFAAGVALYAWRDHVRIDARLALGCAVVFVLAFQLPVTTPFGLLAYAYLCLWAGVECWRPLRRIGSQNDISYGVYVYGFPVQQTLAAVGAAGLGVFPFFLISMAAAAALGWLSWLVVERPVNELVKRVTAQPVRRHRREAGGEQEAFAT